MQVKLKGALEENVLTALCWHEVLAPTIMMRVDAALFSTRAYRLIAKTAFGHLERYSTPPCAHLADLLEQELTRGDEGKLLRATLASMEKLFPQIQPDYISAQLDRFITKRRLTMAVEQAADALHADKLEAAQDFLYQNATLPVDSPGIYLTDTKRVLSFLDQREEDFFPSGIEVLDLMGVRPARKTLTCMLASAKKGKSWWLVEVGKQALMNRKSVLHISLENSDVLTAKRYVQGLYGMTTDRAKTIRVPMFKRDELGRCTGIDFANIDAALLGQDSRALVARKLESLKRRPPLLIKEFPMRSLTIPQLNAYLDSLKRVDNFTPDLLIVDYPGIMKLDPRNLRTELGVVFGDLRGIATTRNMAVVVVAQGNRLSANSNVVGTTNVAEDWSIIGAVDTLLTYSQTSAEKELGLARVLVGAAREIRDGFIVQISQSYETGQFCLDSVYMSKHIEAEVNSLSGRAEEEDE